MMKGRDKKMSKNKKKSFWGENVTEESQMCGMENLIKLTRLMERGDPLPDMSFGDMEDSDVEFNAELNTGIGDALDRLMQKNATEAMPEGFNPLTPTSFSEDVPVVDPITLPSDADEGESVTLREMEIVEPEKPAEQPVRMVPQSFVTAEDVIPDSDDSDDEEFEYDDQRPLEFGDFSILYAFDDWFHISNPYNSDQRVSISTFNLRGYNVEKNDMYQLMLKYVPVMVALLAGPALIIKQDTGAFKKFMRSSIDRGIAVDKHKFMIFTVENNEDKMFMIYLIDEKSRAGIVDNILPTLIERGEEADFFVQLAGLVLNPIINPYGMIDTMWPGDRASEEIDNSDKVDEFINLMMAELGIEPIESSKTGYSAADAAFRKKSVIGDIQQFLKSVKSAKEELEKQMNPGNYQEKFLEEESANDAEATEATEEEPSAEVPSVNGEDLFDGVGTDVTAEAEASAGNAPEAKPATQAKPQKAGADGKKGNPAKKYEIPVQR